MGIFSKRTRASTEAYSTSTTQITPTRNQRESFNPALGVCYAAGFTFLCSSAAFNLLYGLKKAGGDPFLGTVFAAIAAAAACIVAISPSACLIGWKRGRYGVAALALIALLLGGSYSVVSALGSASGARETASAAANHTNDSRKRLQTQYKQTDASLALLPSTPPASKFEAQIDGLLRDPRTEGCVGAYNGPVTREVCPKVDQLRADLAVAQSRQRLEQKRVELAKALASLPRPKVANSDAVSLSSLSSALGYDIDADTWNRLLVVLTVLLVELGSGLSFATALAFRREIVGKVAESTNPAPKTIDAEPPAPDQSENTFEPKVVHPVVQAENTDVPEGEPLPRDVAAQVIVDRLKEMGGQTQSSERGLAKLIGVDRSTVRRAVAGLVTAGVVMAEATRNGTILRLLT